MDWRTALRFLGLAVIGLLLAQPSFARQGDPFFRLLAPAGGENWELNQEAIIAWISRGVAGNVACELFRDRSRVAWIFRRVPVRDGFYQWRVAGEGIRPGGGYQVRLTTLDDGRSYVSPVFWISESSQSFERRTFTAAKKTGGLRRAGAAASTALKVLSPVHEEQWRVFDEYPIRWQSAGLATDDEIAIALKSDRQPLAKIVAVTANSGEYRYRVPYPQVFFGHDIHVIVTPLRDRSLEVVSDPFTILRPEVDLICNTPSVSFRFERKNRKWWERIGDVFTCGITWYVNEVVESARLGASGAAMEIRMNAIQRGGRTLRDVQVGCDILERGFNVIHSFPSKTIPEMRPDQAYPLVFAGATKPMGLKKSTYSLRVWLDPLNRQGEMDRLRENNRMDVEFEVK